jgi:hypothetical protein
MYPQVSDLQLESAWESSSVLHGLRINELRSYFANNS